MSPAKNIAMCDYQVSETNRQTYGWTDRQTPDKVIPMCRYALQVTQQKQCLSVYQTEKNCIM